MLMLRLLQLWVNHSGWGQEKSQELLMYLLWHHTQDQHGRGWMQLPWIDRPELGRASGIVEDRRDCSASGCQQAFVTDHLQGEDEEA